jgi:hypothetical protein
MTPTEAAAPTAGLAPTTVPQGQQMVPFRRAAGAIRTDFSVNDTNLTLSSGQQKLIHTVPGTGYMCWLDLIGVNSVTANASSTSVVYTEDAPWTILGPTTLDAGGGQTVNLQNGYEIHLVNLYGGYFPKDDSLSTDTTDVYIASASGTGATAGNLFVRCRIPLIVNEHSLWGLMGNQSRGTKYNLRNDLGASGDVYTTAPSANASTYINRIYGYLPVPGDKSARGTPQEKVPSDYGIIHWITSAKNEAAPSAGLVNHYVRNLQNAVRTFILIFRQGSGTTPRSSAQTALAGVGTTNITLKIGSDVIFNETYDERRRIMYQQYNFDGPNGVLCYSFIQDRIHFAGWEFGDTYLYLGDITEAQFIITYPTGYTASASNSLTIITDALSIPDGVTI